MVQSHTTRWQPLSMSVEKQITTYVNWALCSGQTGCYQFLQTVSWNGFLIYRCWFVAFIKEHGFDMFSELEATGISLVHQNNGYSKRPFFCEEAERDYFGIANYTNTQWCFEKKDYFRWSKVRRYQQPPIYQHDPTIKLSIFHNYIMKIRLLNSGMLPVMGRSRGSGWRCNWYQTCWHHWTAYSPSVQLLFYPRRTCLTAKPGWFK